MDASLTIRHLYFIGPRKEPVGIEFSYGLNVVYGASETGKSFILDGLDFMLGSGATLRDIPERVGYDRVLLGVEDSFGQSFTFERSTSGGDFLCYEGLHREVPANVQGVVLRAKHNPNREDNLSRFLLKKIGLDSKRIKKNARGETNSLSFRNLVHLCLINEEDIQKQGSPFETGQVISRTAEMSTLKLLLTGVDDSAVVPAEQDKTRSASRAAKVEVIDELIESYRDRLSGLVGEEDDAGELTDQITRLNESLTREDQILGQTEQAYRAALGERNRLRGSLEEAHERSAEIQELLARFRILENHYESDLRRLAAIREAGTLVGALDARTCPLCAAPPDAQHLDGACDGNTDAVVAAANAEIEKIELLLRELRETVSQLRSEEGSFGTLVPRLEEQLAAAEARIADLSPSLTSMRAAYATLMNERSIVQNALNLLASIADLHARRAEIEGAPPAAREVEVLSTDLSFSVLGEFSKTLEDILLAWSFPEADRVHFDKESRDFIISGKPRGARGKGMRAITHAAVTVALLEFTKAKQLSHPGFVVLDTPLLAYREPEGDEDDLSGTDVHERFYEYLAQIAERQVIVLENVDPPASIQDTAEETFFSKNPHSGRYGFFLL